MLMLLLFVLLASIPFLVPHTGFIALFSFVPLFEFARRCDSGAYKHPNWLAYLAFLVFNIVTTFWIWWISPAGAVAAIVLNALQMYVVFWLFQKTKKVFQGALPYIFFISMWIAWERAYQVCEISWPWLILGNSFATATKLVQWYEYTGFLGGSLWVLLVSFLTFTTIRLFIRITSGELGLKRRVAASCFATVLAICVPIAISLSIYRHYTPTNDAVEVVAVQPNIDSYTEKHGGLSQDVQDQVMLDLAEPLITDNTRYLITPETFTFNFDLDSPEMNSTYQNVGRFLERHPNVNVILGALSYKFYMNKRQATPTARLVANGVWYDHYNTALMIDRNGLRNWYHKSKLVPGVEIVPYQQQLKFLGAIFDKFGGATGSYARSERVENLSTADGAQVGAMICYESIYGDWFRHCADLGAGFVTVITNDGWWGDTPGYRQHFRFASLRAIENRRDVVHVANTGITGFIDQRGDVVQRTGWWEPVAIKGVVNLNQQKTFYTINGDMTGRICTMLFLLLLVVYVARALMLAIESKPVKKKK